MTTRLFLLLLLSLTVWSTPALAHSSYKHLIGTFLRGDGDTISIVEIRSDGIVAADPVRVHFIEPHGRVTASTGFFSDIALWRPSVRSVDVYQFESTFLPIASRVDRFDGEFLSEITSASTRAVSPLVHTAYHWRGYTMALAVAAFLVVLWSKARVLSRRRDMATMRVLAATAGALYLVVVLWMTSLSVPVLFSLGIIVRCIYTVLRRVLPRKAKLGH